MRCYDILAIISIASRHAALFISRFYSMEFYRDSVVPLSSNDNDKTHFLSFSVESTLLSPSNFCFEHRAIIIIPRVSFFRPGIDGIINKHHANYSATVLLIFSPHFSVVIYPWSPTWRLIIPHRYVCVSARSFDDPRSFGKTYAYTSLHNVTSECL